MECTLLTTTIKIDPILGEAFIIWTRIGACILTPDSSVGLMD